MPEAPAPESRSGSTLRPAWSGDVTRVPYWVYRDDELLKTEQRRLFEGAVWNYLCLESEIAHPGDWRATVVGQMPVVATR
ncbi:MAG: anthranilate 1,2-dioxygenase large subunit, partial [Acetobacteraceae bacterium]|nr:anthranilate 1,2-dioxygenase large subunit [Acetobacteraceae bacterium]